ncbi:F-box and associated interaction domains-containing protein [Prunus dulcis]|uniref:F-box and associated interaction domains-containing protein n=1 Tax=Prunus dulcis TaxID=3755 RepID=A0A4Y1RCH5_PRUDU|nr:F-box and associated interaction domains-containing protein [Prunus dulcis]
MYLGLGALGLWGNLIKTTKRNNTTNERLHLDPKLLYNYLNVQDMDNIQDITQLIYTFKVEAFPQEIIHEILFRLPVKSLINCTSVCKPWRSMIMNQSFIQAHFSHTVDFANQKDIDLLLFHRISGSGRTIYCHNTVIHKVALRMISPLMDQQYEFA